jgi:ribosomal protein S18 acetylase RimI-like enzyme
MYPKGLFCAMFGDPMSKAEFECIRRRSIRHGFPLSYSNVMDAWPYRADLDWVIQAPKGELASFALAWLDDVNRVGELEPVGTDPIYRGLGLGRAVSLAALHALRNAGAENAVVYPRGDDAYPIPARLYGGMGFMPRARTVTYEHWLKHPLVRKV